MLVGIGFLVLGDTFGEPRLLPAHVLLPLLVLFDRVLFGHSQANTRWWYPLSWVSGEIAYLVLYLVAGRLGWPQLYPFLDPGSGSFAAVVAGFLIATMMIGYFLYGAGKIRGAAAAGAGGELEPDLATASSR